VRRRLIADRVEKIVVVGGGGRGRGRMYHELLGSGSTRLIASHGGGQS
jgi:hypothetical protein